MRKGKLLLVALPMTLVLASCGGSSRTVKNNVKNTSRYFTEVESFTMDIHDNHNSNDYKFEFDHGKFKVTKENGVFYFQIYKNEGENEYFKNDRVDAYVESPVGWVVAQTVVDQCDLKDFKAGINYLFSINTDGRLLTWSENADKTYSTNFTYNEYNLNLKISFDSAQLVDTCWVEAGSSSGSVSLRLAFSNYGKTTVTLPEVVDIPEIEIPEGYEISGIDSIPEGYEIPENSEISEE